ncbi:hypothetical protein NDU88_006498 [Pleurodeles waltl]|uniref:Uncharacterized protein n=1 Tax=Pleurodeles waltl TaxID=8319 RepID=A0AAV7X1U5_PLEWA|nr:hypothetical protein NDU88_006498 [Pleurodeles waltl]
MDAFSAWHPAGGPHERRDQTTHATRSVQCAARASCQAAQVDSQYVTCTLSRYSFWSRYFCIWRRSPWETVQTFPFDNRNKLHGHWLRENQQLACFTWAKAFVHLFSNSRGQQTPCNCINRRREGSALSARAHRDTWHLFSWEQNVKPELVLTMYTVTEL